MEKAELYALDLTGAPWEKSSFSGSGDGSGDGCVEVAHLEGGAVAFRDSKNPGRPALMFTADEWNAFCLGIEAGELRG